jgi:phytoene synthase
VSVLAPDRSARALRYCREVTRRRARNFYHGLKLLPEPQRSALFTVYAWMRRADDLVDTAADASADVASGRLAELRTATDAALAGRADPDDPVLVGLQHTAHRFPLDGVQLHAMIDGQLDDLAGTTYETFDDLLVYCRRVASSVGLVCIGIWGFDDPEAPDRAVERGIAFQLTNILRDVREDHGRGRVYLPADEFARHDLTPAALLELDDPARCHRFLDEQIERAEWYYRCSAPLDAMIAPACRPALWAMTAIYHRLLGRMSHDPLRLVRGPRVRLSALNKGSIAIRAQWWARRRRAPARVAAR